MRSQIHYAKLPLSVAAILLAAGACTQEPNDGIAAGADLAREPDVATSDRPDVSERVAAVADPAAQDAAAEIDAQQLVDEAITVVNRIQGDRQAAALLNQAQGIFIIPDYAQAGLVVGGEGGKGIVLLKSAGADAAPDADPTREPNPVSDAGASADAGVAGDDGQWSDPVFYNFGGVTAGAEAGVEIGSVAMLLMSEQATEMFRAEQTGFSIDASAGLTIIDFSARADAAAGEGDIIVWTDTAGAFAGGTIGVNGVNRDEDDTEAFYGPGVDTESILSGELTSDRTRQLREALAG